MSVSVEINRQRERVQQKPFGIFYVVNNPVFSGIVQIYLRNEPRFALEIVSGKEEAQERVGDSRWKCDVALVDLNVGGEGEDGIKFAEWFHGERPNIPIYLMSEWIPEIRVRYTPERLQEVGITRVLPKAELSKLADVLKLNE